MCIIQNDRDAFCVGIINIIIRDFTSQYEVRYSLGRSSADTGLRYDMIWERGYSKY